MSRRQAIDAKESRENYWLRHPMGFREMLLCCKTSRDHVVSIAIPNQSADESGSQDGDRVTGRWSKGAFGPIE